jgi:hypothetical protein
MELHSYCRVCTECFDSGSSCWFMQLQRLYWFRLPAFLTAVQVGQSLVLYALLSRHMPRMVLGKRWKSHGGELLSRPKFEPVSPEIEASIYTSSESILVASRSKAGIVFAHSNAGIVVSNSTQRHECLCVGLFYVCVVLWVGSGLATGWSFVQGVLPSV